MIFIDVIVEGGRRKLHNFLVNENVSVQVIAEQILKSLEIEIKPDMLIDLSSQCILNSTMTFKEQGVKSGSSLLILIDN